MATNELALLPGKGAIHAGFPLINDLTGLMLRKLDSPLGYPEVLAEPGIGDQQEEFDNLRNYYLSKVGQIGILTQESNDSPTRCR